MLRLAGARAPSNSLQEYLDEREAMEALPPPAPGPPDWPARIVAGKGVLLEGFEVVLIVAALGAGPEGRAPAGDGRRRGGGGGRRLGFVLHRPLARLPESHLKYAVGVVLSCFGVFFLGRGSAPSGRAATWRCSTSRASSLLASQVQGGQDRGGVKALRKLILGETWALPIGVALTLVVGLVLESASWWPEVGGFVFLALVLGALFVSLRR